MCERIAEVMLVDDEARLARMRSGVTAAPAGSEVSYRSEYYIAARSEAPSINET